MPASTSRARSAYSWVGPLGMGLALACVAFAVTIFLPVVSIWIGVGVALVGAIGGLSTRDVDRSHVYGRLAVVGSAWLIGASVYLCIAALR